MRSSADTAQFRNRNYAHGDVENETVGARRQTQAIPRRVAGKPRKHLDQREPSREQHTEQSDGRRCFGRDCRREFSKPGKKRERKQRREHGESVPASGIAEEIRTRLVKRARRDEQFVETQIP